MDNQLMLILGSMEISWFAVFTALACFAGTCIACLLRYMQRRDINDIFTCVAFGTPLGLLFGRILYIAFSGSGLSGFWQYVNLTNGGFGLFGVFLGVFLGVCIAVKFFDAEGLGSLLDCLSIGGAFAVTIGRFATAFTSTEIGYEVDFKLFAVYDSEQGIYNLAIYKLDGLYEAVIFMICLWFFIRCIRKGNRNYIWGKTAMLMLALHGTNQVVMDSMRADPLKLGMNEFIKISQIIGIVCCIVVLVAMMIMTARRNGFSSFHWISIPLIIIAIILGVFGEYRVGSSNYISNHLIMFAGMVILDWLAIEFALYAAGFTDEFKITPSRKKASDVISDNGEPKDDASGSEAQPQLQEAKAASVSADEPSGSVPETEQDKSVSSPSLSPAQAKAEPAQAKAQPVPGKDKKYAKMKTIPVISVDAQGVRQNVKKTAADEVKTGKTSAVQKSNNPASSIISDESRDKPLGEQELNMNRIISELDKIEG